MTTIAVRIDSNRPIFIEADADSFGKVFSTMNSDDQVEVLRAMVNHMKPWATQWDHIGIELEKPENREIMNTIKGMFG